MQHPKLKINNEDIPYAQYVLLDNGGVFDDDRKTFIKNLDTIDIQAVPGSGKTTALLAKLLILERHLPFEDGSGILVISHTNAAVDEIKNRIGQYCPKLFAYPNFVGTIQAFTDTFLAIPYYSQKYGKRPWRIDDEIYREKAGIFATKIFNGFSQQDQKNAKYYLHLKGIVNQYRFDIQNNKLILIDSLNGKLLDFIKPKGRTRPQNYLDFTSEEKGNIKKWLMIFKQQIMIDDGVLDYDDAYFLAKCYLLRYPKIKKLLQKRFRYIFVDEMQDIDSHQYNLLEKIFFNDGNSPSIYQRIGDKNQAIFSRDVKLEEIWKDRDKVLHIFGSRRLTSETAKVVEPFGMPRVQIEGRNLQEKALPPHLIVFDDNSIIDVLPKYCKLIKNYMDEGKIPKDCNHPFKAIAWRKGDDGKFGLKNYLPEYEPNISKSKIDYPNLKSNLFFAKNGGHQNSLVDIRKNILNAFLKVLRLEQIKNPDSKTGYYSIESLQKYLKEKQADFYDVFQLQIFHWCRNIYLEKTEDVFISIKQFIPQLLNCFDKKLEKSNNFVNDENLRETPELSDKSKKSVKKDNIYRCDKTGIEVEIGTVHSVKGQTHTATLYMESNYQGDFESNRLKICFEGKDHNFSKNPKNDVHKKESLRMVYVGFSRPTHLLCFAVHKDRYDKDIFKKNGWIEELIYDVRN